VQIIQKQASPSHAFLPIAFAIPIETAAKKINPPMTIRTIIYAARVLIRYVLKVNSTWPLE
jgi:hypothetical protein